MLRQTGAARQWLKPAPAPSCSISGLWQRGWRRALPPNNSSLSTTWLGFGSALVKARWWQVVNASLPSMTAGGRAMEPISRQCSHHQNRQWSLPASYLLMPMDSRRWHSAFNLYGIQLVLIRYFMYDHAVRCIWKPWSSSFRWSARVHTYASPCARDSREIARCTERWSFPFRVQNAHTVHPEGARSVSKQVGSLSYTSVNTFKPSRNALISQISTTLIWPAGSVRPS